MRSTLKVLVAATSVSLSVMIGFAETGEHGMSEQRLSDSADANRNTTQEIAKAVRLGHIVPGMDSGQVTAALGEPISQKQSSKTAGMEHWLYRIERLHQEEFRGRGWSFVRITFADGRVVMLDPR